MTTIKADPCPVAQLQAPTFADVNADGELEVLLGGTSGAIFALSGISGEDSRNFPFYTQVPCFPGSG